MKLIIASSNKNKIAEIKEMLNNIEIMSLSDIGFNDENRKRQEKLLRKMHSLRLKQFIKNIMSLLLQMIMDYV